METRLLRYFLAVGREGSVTRAAERLHTSQPNLSHQLLQLEDSLGTKLFVRGRRRVALTEEGRFLMRRAEEIVELLDRTRDDLKGFSSSVSGTVHVGCVETPSVGIFIPAIREISEKYPNISIEYVYGGTSQLLEALELGFLDGACVFARDGLNRYACLKCPGQDELGVLVRRDHPLARKASVRSSDIGAEKVWLPEQLVENDTLAGWLGKSPKSLNLVATFNTNFIPAMNVEEGVGIAFMIDKVINTAGRNLCFRPLSPRIRTETYIVWKKDTPLTHAAAAFLESIRAILGRH